MTRAPLLLLAALVLALGAGAGTVKVIDVLDERSRVRLALREAAVMGNVDPDIMEAIGYVESRWKLDALNLDGSDGARGGSYGPTQISERTARAYGYTGDMLDFCDDEKLAALWTAKILRARPGGPPATAGDAAAWWNAGHATLATVSPSSSAVTAYLPELRAALAKVTA